MALTLTLSAAQPDHACCSHSTYGHPPSVCDNDGSQQLIKDTTHGEKQDIAYAELQPHRVRNQRSS